MGTGRSWLGISGMPWRVSQESLGQCCYTRAGESGVGGERQRATVFSRAAVAVRAAAYPLGFPLVSSPRNQSAFRKAYQLMIQSKYIPVATPRSSVRPTLPAVGGPACWLLTISLPLALSYGKVPTQGFTAFH